MVSKHMKTWAVLWLWHLLKNDFFLLKHSHKCLDESPACAIFTLAIATTLRQHHSLFDAKVCQRARLNYSVWDNPLHMTNIPLLLKSTGHCRQLWFILSSYSGALNIKSLVYWSLKHQQCFSNSWIEKLSQKTMNSNSRLVFQDNVNQTHL